MKKFLLSIFSLIIIMGMCYSPIQAEAPIVDPRVNGLGEAVEAVPEVIDDGSTIATYIILLEGESLAGYEGDIPGLRATTPSKTGAIKLDVTSADSVAYLDYLRGKQDAFLASLSPVFGRAATFVYRYDVVLNGFSMELSAGQARSIAKKEGVKAVLKDEIRQLDTDTSPEFLGVDTLWDETEGTTPGSLETKGEGMLIGVLDTGINMDHPSFAAVGPVDAYVHVNPFGTGVFKGLCASNPTQYICNDKLVGVWGYTGDTETMTGEDGHAHGSHTASTSAGNALTADYNGLTVNISGMAPHANIIAYDVCDASGCANSDSTAAVNQAITDGVDVLNYSIGPSSGASDPYADPVELAMLDAIAAGVLTATSAGNSGPNASTVYKAPAWNIVVANSSHNRSFGVNVIVDVDPTAGDSFELTGVVGSGPVYNPITGSLKWAGPSYTEGCNTTPFPADYFDGYIALISRGTCGFAEKVANATAAGADAVVVYNNRKGPAIVMGALESTTIPAVMVDQADGLAAIDYLTVTHLGEDVTIELTDDFVRRINDDWADIIDQQTSRGPYLLHDILEPEVAAPGTNIMAAYNTPVDANPYGQVDPGDVVEIDLMSGTSMASPHVAGSALLLKDLFPTWTPLEIKSALMMTADKSAMLKDNGVTPADIFDVGNGRIDLTKAALTGLVMNETKANFVAADPAEDGDVKTLNIPSYQNTQCIGDCTFTRTFRNVADVDTEYTVAIEKPADVEIVVTPSTFTIPVGGTQTVTVDIDVSGATIGTWQFAYISFETDDSFTTLEEISDVRIPLAIVPDAGNLPALVEETVYRDAGGTTLEDLYSIEITDMTFEQAGLTEATIYDFQLDPDPTNGDPFDDLSQVWYTTFTIPVGAKRMVLEVLDTSAGDLDLFWGWGSTPSEATLYDSSATGAALEYYSWLDPWDDPYWVLIQNWDGAPLDDVKLAVAIVPTVDEGNFEITGPSAVAAGDFFDLDITWDEPAMEPFSAWYGWFNVGTEVGSPGDIGETELNIYRPYDDVTKKVSDETADVGQTLTYTITIAPNETGADLAYNIEDVLPSGVTYVPGSLETTGSFVDATYEPGINTVIWSGTMPKIEYTYIASTPENNPDYCANPWGGGYLDLKSLGRNPIAGLAGDGIVWGFTGYGVGTQFYGETIPTKPSFTDDGHFYMYPFGGFDTDYWNYTNQNFPDATVPNGIVSPWMRDMIIVYEAGNKGVTAVSWSSGALWLVEFDDVVDYYSTEPAYAAYATGVMDFEVFVWRDLDPSIGYPDIIFAYDNVTGDWDWTGGPWGSVGLENVIGMVGTTFAYDDWTPTSGDLVCLDYAVAGAEPVVITFDVLVGSQGSDTEITNTVAHTADGLGMREEEASTSFTMNLTLTDLDLFSSIDLGTWIPVPGSYEEGFALLMDPLNPFYYLNTDNLVVNSPLADGAYPFFLDQTNLPAGFAAYWDAKGVNASADPASWQGVMYQIITGDQPMFYLKVVGTSYDLIDGLQFLTGAVENPLRVSGDYPIGTYTFTGEVEDDLDNKDDVTVDITFLSPFDLTDLDLLSSIDLVSWKDVAGTFADGFYLDLDPVNDYYYLDTEDLVANRPAGDGLYPFYLDQTDLPAGFAAYWSAKGVVSGATGWQGIMYQIITGTQPMFYLKVDGTSYDLIDGLQLLIGQGENPLRVSGDYPFGTYIFAGEVEDEFGYSDDVTVDITFISPLDLTDLDLLSSEDATTWIPVPGSFEDGFGLVIDPLVAYYYLDTEALVVNRSLADGKHPFFLDTTALPAGFYSYWSAKGVMLGATGWQGVMWQIINGDQPMFYLKVDGTSYDLIDGLQFLAGGGENPLRVSGDYPLGTYKFVGDVKDDFGLKDNVTVDITFLAPLALTDLDLLESLDTIAWATVPGDFTTGFNMTLDPVNAFYYLDTENLVVNRPIEDGSYPFFLDQTDLPAGFAAYWAAKGVVSGAGGWQGVMYQIITGTQPMFYLKVDGTSYDLIDGLQFLTGAVENPLRVSGDYPFGTYTFTGEVADEWGYTDDVVVDITFNDKPVAYDDDYQTDEDVAVAIVLEAIDGWPGDPLIWIVGEPANGTLTGTAPNLTYTPDADFYGTDSFTFHVNDGFNDSNVATITIEVIPLNDSPLAVDDHYTTPMSTTLTVAAPGVMTNDVDPDPTDLKMVILVSGTTHGTVTLYGDGSFIYVPNAGYIGPDSFVYNFLSLPTRAFIDQAVVYIDVTGTRYYLPLIIK